MKFIDWVQVISAVTSAMATILAYIAIRQSAKNSRANQEALIRERRINFELDSLDKIAAILAPLFAWSKVEDFNDHLKHEQVAHRIWMLVMALGEEELPLLRGLVRADTTPEAQEVIGEKELDGLSDYRLQGAIQNELVQATKRRLEAR